MGEGRDEGDDAYGIKWVPAFAGTTEKNREIKLGSFPRFF